MSIGVGCFLFALLILSADKNAGGFAAFIGFIALLFVLGGLGARKKPAELVVAQESWDKRWTCARCGNQWEAD